MTTRQDSAWSGKGNGWTRVTLAASIAGAAMLSLYSGLFPSGTEGASVVSPRGTLLPAIPGLVRVPEDQPTIQAAIDAALPGETVAVAPGFWDERVTIRGKAITLRGLAGAERTVLSGTASPGPVLTIEGALAKGTRIEGFTLSGGNGPEGHGILVREAEATVRESRIERNAAGGAANVRGDLSLIGCTLTANAAPVSGGGVRSAGAMTALIGCTISGNSAGTFGGGVFAEGGTLSLVDTTIASNRTTSGAWGGGLWAENADVFASQTAWTGNSSIESGGAAYFRGGTADLHRCTFDGNSSPSAYGLFSEGAHVRLRESTLCGLAGDAIAGDHIDASGAEFSSCYQDCNRNGMRDADEIAMGFQPDADRNGILDACEQPSEESVTWVIDEETGELMMAGDAGGLASR